MGLWANLAQRQGADDWDQDKAYDEVRLRVHCVPASPLCQVQQGSCDVNK